MKKKLTTKQKKIIDVSVTCLQIAVVIVAIVISIIVIANPIVSSAKVTKSRTKLLPVQSNSMDGSFEDSFKKGDLLIAKTPKDPLALEVGDIITYVGAVEGFEALITHRIVEVKWDEQGKAETYYTLGDAESRDNQATAINPYDVLAVYQSHLKGVGKAIDWLQDDTHFLLVVVLPLIALFVYNIIAFVRVIMQGKMEKLKLAAENAPVMDEEEIKRKAIEEYLSKQSEQASQDEKSE